VTLFEVDETLTVAQVNRAIAGALKRAFRNEVWVQGQIRNLKRSQRGHVYFDLIDPVPAGAVPKASVPVTLFDSNRQVVNRIIKRTGNSVRIDDGVEVRIRGAIELYAPRGQVQLNMSSIDPEFTLGRLGADRDRLLEALRTEGLLEANRGRPMPLVPLRVALITSEGSAAHADFTQQLGSSGYAFEITTLTTRVQGEFAPIEVAEAIAACEHLDLDVVALVRGGGARTDLATFDAEPVARAIAACQTPVLCGIGHEIDQSVADLVAHATFKTPTACAQALVERVVDFDFALRARSARLAERAALVPARERQRVNEAATAVRAGVELRLAEAEGRQAKSAAELERRVGQRIVRSSARLADRRTRVELGARHVLAAATRRADTISGELRTRPLLRLDAAEGRLDLLRARLDAVDPVVALRRGWSITTTADGRVVRSTGDVVEGDRLAIRLADGRVSSTVTSVAPDRTQEQQ